MGISSEEELERWRQWFEGQQQTDVIPQAIDAYNSARLFKQRVEKLSAKDELECLQFNDTKQKCLELTKSVLREATSAQTQWAKKRSQGLRKAPQKLQTFATKFSKFLENYAGIVEIMKSADYQYGNLAYGTVSLLFLVAVNKTAREDTLESCLVDFGEYISAVCRLHSIAPTVTVSRLLGNVYSNVIQVARSATLYYQKNSLSRLWQSVTHPPKLYLDDMVQAVKHDVDAIKVEASIKSQERVQRMNAQLYTDEERQRQQRLWQLRPKFQGISGNRNVQTEYAAALKDPKAQPDDVEDFEFKNLASKNEFISWQDSAKSSLLLLRGKTAHTWTNFSWLSLAAIEVIKLLEQDEKSTTLYWFVNPQAFVSGTNLFPAHRLFSEFIWQLLHSRPDILDQPQLYHDLQEQLPSSEWTESSLTLPCQALKHILGHFQSINVVIDRLDRMSCSPLTFIERWVETMSGAGCKIKTFIVLGDLKHLDEATITSPPDIELHVVTMDQALID